MNQTDRVKEHMEKYGSITTMDAFRKYGITRLSARMFELKQEGYQFVANRESVVNRYGEKVGICRYTKSSNQ